MQKPRVQKLLDPHPEGPLAAGSRPQPSPARGRADLRVTGGKLSVGHSKSQPGSRDVTTPGCGDLLLTSTQAEAVGRLARW
jgi:hypothetical protein